MIAFFRNQGEEDEDEATDKAQDDTKETKKERKKKKQRDPNNPDDDGEDSDEIDVDFARDGQIVVKTKEERTEEEIKMDESRPPSRPISATFSERNALQASAVAAKLEGTEAADGEPTGPRKLKRSAEDGIPVLEQAADLSGPQRFLVTIDEVEELEVDDGQIFLRLTMGNITRESKRYPCGDQLVQGITRPWTKVVKINEEFYWEIGDNDAYVSCLLMHIKAKPGSEAVDLGEVKLHAKGFGTRAVQEVHKFQEAGVLKMKGSKLSKGGEAEHEDDEQAIMAAMQKHAVVLTGTMRMSIRIIQAKDIPAMDEGNTSDPYLIITCGQMKKRSKVIQQTLTPQWHEDFDFFFAAKTTVPAMEIEMWDRDPSSRDDFMGKATLAIGALTDLRPRQEWVKMRNGNVGAGKVQIYMSMEPKVGQSDSPLKNTILNWFSTEDNYLMFWEGTTGGMGG